MQIAALLYRFTAVDITGPYEVLEPPLSWIWAAGESTMWTASAKAASAIVEAARHGVGQTQSMFMARATA